MSPLSTAPAPTARPVAFRWDDAVHTTGAARKSDDSGHYTVTRNGESFRCTCRGFMFTGHCKHADAARAKHLAPPPPARYCEHCRIDVARQCGLYCSDRCQQAAAHEALMVMPVDLADAVVEQAPEAVEQDTEPCAAFGHCIVCGDRFAHDEDDWLACPKHRGPAPVISGIALVEIVPSSPEAIAYTEELKRETTWTLVAGVSPQFAGIA